jgi:hypothetical protein
MGLERVNAVSQVAAGLPAKHVFGWQGACLPVCVLQSFDEQNCATDGKCDDCDSHEH